MISGTSVPLFFLGLITVCTSALAADSGAIIGWRGDGTGRYPDADPPLAWSKTADGHTTNILWQKKMPCYSWSTPLVVGDRLIVRSEPYDLVCLDKKTGNVLWYRAHGPWEIVKEEDRKGPAWKDVQDQVAQLEAVNASCYGPAGPTDDLIKKKAELQKNLNKLLGRISPDYRIAPEMWRSKWAGYTGSTPCSDGKLIWYSSSMGVIGCYDLDGNRKWVANELITQDSMGEHGSGSSPAIVGNLFIDSINEAVVALDRQDGAPKWRPKLNTGDDSETVVGFIAGGQQYLIAKKHFLRASDGKEIPFTDEHIRGMSMHATPVIDGNRAYLQDSAGRLFTLSWEPQAGGDISIKREYLTEFPIADNSKRWDNAYNFWVPSPLVLDGLVYCLSNQGRLVVCDAAKGQIISDQILDLNLNLYGTSMHGGYIVGQCASPALAGKHIFIIGNTGTTLILEPGPKPKVIATNHIEQMVQPWDPGHWDKPHAECTLASPVFDGPRLYLRSELYLYCLAKP